MDAFFLPAMLPKDGDTTAVLEPPRVAPPAAEPTLVAAPETVPVAAPAPVQAAAAAAPAAVEPAISPVIHSDSGEPIAEGSDPQTNKLKIIVRALRQMEQNIGNIIRLLEEQGPTDAVVTAALDAAHVNPRELELASVRPQDGRVTEGVFDGRQMIGADGKTYSVPPNYASKSKLVEGDLLKLTITPKGSFIYKQIGPIERARVVASLGFDQTIGEFYAAEGDKRWNVLKASVTFFKGEQDDEVVLLVPKNAPSKWAAVENIIKRNPLV